MSRSSSASFASASLTPQASVPASERMFSEAPTVMTFLAVPGESIERLPSAVPSFPAAKTWTISWLPEFGLAELRRVANDRVVDPRAPVV